jgi:SPP1 gp7 family putative phage head morphogenesis protein
MKFLVAPVPHTEASAFIKNKPVVSGAVFAKLLPEVRARVFTVSGMVPLDIAQRLRDRISEIPAGADWDAVKADVAAGLSPFLDPETSTAEGEVPASERKAELLLRTHGYQAYAASQYNVLDRQKDVFKFWRYQTAQDDRVRDSHAALEGIVLPADDVFWQTHFPPWDYNCRCTVVPLSDADVAEIQQDDEKLPPDERSILTETQRDTMNMAGTLLRGPNSNVDVRSPRQKSANGGDGYAWQPGDLRLPIATLRERYDPDVFAAFETFAKKTELADGRSIYDWLGATPAPAGRARPPVAVVVRKPVVKPTPTPTPAPEPAPVAPPVVAHAKPRAPVSAVFQMRPETPVGKVVTKALSAIDAVHDDGLLPPVPIISTPGGTANGHFHLLTKEIAVRPSGPWPQLTTAHEVGHLLDYTVLGEAGTFASEVHADFAEWRRAVRASEAITSIRATQGTVKGLHKAEYYLRGHEMWARSYAQYIATKSGDAEMLRQLDIIRGVGDIGHLIQWSDADFAPIAAAIENILKKKGWLLT